MRQHSSQHNIYSNHSLDLRNLKASDLDSTEPFCDDLKEVGTGHVREGFILDVVIPAEVPPPLCGWAVSR